MELNEKLTMEEWKETLSKEEMNKLLEVGEALIQVVMKGEVTRKIHFQLMKELDDYDEGEIMDMAVLVWEGAEVQARKLMEEQVGKVK